MFHRFLNNLPVLIMPGLRIWQGCEHARVTQGAGSHNIPEQALIYLKNVQNCLNMREYAENEYD